jgi:sugar phosphate isomerase/epimerase
LPPATAIAERIAVCSWSLQPADLPDLIAKLREAGITRVQLALNPLRESPAHWTDAAQRFHAAGIKLVSGSFGCLGEDYSTLESIRLTGGIAPDATWEQNLQIIRATVRLAAELGLKLVTFHAGFLPEDETTTTFAKMLGRLTIVADIFSNEQIGLALETGQETAPVLAALLKKLDHPALGVNFDPANLILYAKGDPVEALGLLGPWIRQIHVKDARRARVPGSWGEEVVAGTGEVDWPGFFSALEQIHFMGHLVIEREAGAQRIADIRAARELILHSAK